MEKHHSHKKKKVLSFKQVDEELLREYNEQFSKGYEYIDIIIGDKKFRRYNIPQDEPNIEEPNLLDIIDIIIRLGKLKKNKNSIKEKLFKFLK